MATTPVISCECEHSCSRLIIIKTYLRSTMSEDRLNGISLLYIHNDIEIDYDYIISKFALRNPRRMQSIYIYKIYYYIYIIYIIYIYIYIYWINSLY